MTPTLTLYVDCGVHENVYKYGKSSSSCYAYLLLLSTSSFKQNANTTVSQYHVFPVLSLLKGGVSLAGPMIAANRSSDAHSDIVSLPVRQYCKLQHKFASISVFLL